MVMGKLLKGEGKFHQVRAAYAWSCVPLIVNIPMWFVLAWAFGSQLFGGLTEEYMLNNRELVLLFAILLVRLGSTVWSLVIYINALAEVQRFSVLRAIGNLLLAGSVIFLLLYSVSYLFMTMQ